MRYLIEVEGATPIVMRSARGIDPESPERQEIAEITAKRGNNKTTIDTRRVAALECQLALWLDDEDKPTIPPFAFRACIERASRKLKEGTLVREGLIIESCQFTYDTEKYGTSLQELVKTTQFRVPVVVQRSRIIRTRAKFDDWSAMFVADTDEELIDSVKLESWLRIAGMRVGIGDWRPDKSGHYGRFSTTRIEEISEYE